MIQKEHQARGPNLSVHTANTHTHTQTRLTHVATKHSSVNTDPCERLGFMELMGGCMGTLPGGSLALFFWWRRSRRRPSSSHHEDRRAGKSQSVSALLASWEKITAEVFQSRLRKN